MPDRSLLPNIKRMAFKLNPGSYFCLKLFTFTERLELSFFRVKRLKKLEIIIVQLLHCSRWIHLEVPGGTTIVSEGPGRN